jgi:hypothetical protein
VATIVECDPNLCWANRRYTCFTVDAGGEGELNKDARGDNERQIGSGQALQLKQARKRFRRRQ